MRACGVGRDRRCPIHSWNSLGLRALEGLSTPQWIAQCRRLVRAFHLRIIGLVAEIGFGADLWQFATFSVRFVR